MTFKTPNWDTYDASRDYLAHRCWDYGVMFSTAGNILVQDHIKGRYVMMHHNHLKILCKEWYVQGGFPLRGKALEKHVLEYIHDAIEVVRNMKKNGEDGKMISFNREFLS
jgi:hypothetical protein